MRQNWEQSSSKFEISIFQNLVEEIDFQNDNLAPQNLKIMFSIANFGFGILKSIFKNPKSISPISLESHFETPKFEFSVADFPQIFFFVSKSKFFFDQNLDFVLGNFAIDTTNVGNTPPASHALPPRRKSMSAQRIQDLAKVFGLAMRQDTQENSKNDLSETDVEEKTNEIITSKISAKSTKSLWNSRILI